ncbi:hypothetical protein HELRODRAFT_183570 [Helobdella robusta]|uniref:Uncharacterized protein n=1 Tax=Helobdella robusta TaxID=6412 RepID=T1FJV0_HELRO|nr:hypothetical protein HELRODRAFT_183570 [Helobdella robusta]ESO10474.1 hypothetical protein HELRODRAFT_183570 [Helobdella robusta]
MDQIMLKKPSVIPQQSGTLGYTQSVFQLNNQHRDSLLSEGSLPFSKLYRRRKNKSPDNAPLSSLVIYRTADEKKSKNFERDRVKECNINGGSVLQKSNDDSKRYNSGEQCRIIEKKRGKHQCKDNVTGQRGFQTKDKKIEEACVVDKSKNVSFQNGKECKKCKPKFKPIRFSMAKLFEPTVVEDDGVCEGIAEITINNADRRIEAEFLGTKSRIFRAQSKMTDMLRDKFSRWIYLPENCKH